MSLKVGEVFIGLGGGEFTYQKIGLGVCPGGWSGLELNDTLHNRDRPHWTWSLNRRWKTSACN